MVSPEGLTPLHIVFMNNFPDIIGLLLIKGAKHDIQDKEKQAPLSLDFSKGHTEIMQIFFYHASKFPAVQAIESAVMKNNFIMTYYATVTGMKQILASVLKEN